ncbi:MAG: FAD-dependent oxidoreductase, partial [Verrucomicrobiota bacterium]|nr:FAD-dependent oxidoreductase [Verrucomicrobiota bacterium]
KLPVSDAIVMTEGKRILFAIPWGERTILGTTDTDYHGSLENVRADATDIQYVLKIANRFFPKAKITAQNIISSWAGLRPLVANLDGTPSDISRSHQIKNPEPNWWDVTGGKLTTYRLMAEQTVDQIVKKNGGNFSPCRTAVEMLLPENETVGCSGILPPEFCGSAVEHYCATEWAWHLDDVMVRRSGWHYYFPDAAKKSLEVANRMSEILDWSPERKTEELSRYKKVTNQ